MTYIAKPRLHHPSLTPNKVGYTRRDYEGKVSTLCAGCGHDSISAAIIQACWELDIHPHRVAKLSGIGCSSKTPDYFLGASFVARSFSGDKAQLVPLIQAAMQHGGAAFIDVISPCVTFNNHAGSTRSYDWVREHNEAVSRIDLILGRQEITVDYAPGEVIDVEQHDGTILRLKKLHADYDPTDRVAAMAYMQGHAVKGELVTGLLYLEAEAGDLHAAQNTSARPLNSLGTAELCPGVAALDKLNAGWR